MASKRITKEIIDFEKDPPRQLKLLEIDPNFKSATFAFAGPINSPYEGHWFRLFVEWACDYPYRPPSIKLLDKIWNPYADFEKKLICIDILREKYSPGLTTLKVLLSIVSLFGESKITDDHEGFANPKAASQMMNNYPFFCQEAKKQCQFHSYKQQLIYEDSQRGMAEDHQIIAEGKQLEQLVEKEANDPSMRKKQKKNLKNDLTTNQSMELLGQPIT